MCAAPLTLRPCLCSRAHITMGDGKSPAYFAWHNYLLKEREPEEGQRTATLAHVKTIAKSGCTMTPGELKRLIKHGATKLQVLEWIHKVAGITDAAVQNQFYVLFNAVRRPPPQPANSSIKRKLADAESPASAADLPTSDVPWAGREHELL